MPQEVSRRSIVRFDDLFDDRPIL